jgi:hypothetical protein
MNEWTMNELMNECVFEWIEMKELMIEWMS